MYWSGGVRLLEIPLNRLQFSEPKNPNKPENGPYHKKVRLTGVLFDSLYLPADFGSQVFFI